MAPYSGGTMRFGFMKKKLVVVDESRHDWAPWTAARFADQDARDRFLRVIAARNPEEVQGAPAPDEARCALVRWRVGQFLRLNDAAYAHGGRIVPAIPTYWA